MSAILNTIGLLVNLAGVIILFRYGMPYRVRTGGAVSLIIEQKDYETDALEARYSIYGNLGLVAIALGTGLQVAANWISPIPD